MLLLLLHVSDGAIDHGSGPTYFTAEVEVLGQEEDETGIDHVDVEYL